MEMGVKTGENMQGDVVEKHSVDAVYMGVRH